MKNKLYIHIGTFKTGSTSIQDFLAANKKMLISHGILYPNTDREPYPKLNKHSSIYFAIKQTDNNSIKIEKKILLDEFERSQCTSMIISAEGLSGAGTRISRFFKSFNKDFDLTTICYLRRQDLFVEALFNQFVKERGRRESVSIIEFCRKPAIQHNMKYYTILNKWKEIGSKIIVFDFDKTRKRYGLLKSFVDTIEANFLTIPELYSNKSPDMNLILILSQMNKLGIEFNIKQLDKLTNQLINQRIFQPTKHILGRDERVRFLSKFDEENEQLERDYGIAFSKELPSDEQPLPILEPNYNFLLSLLALSSHPDGEL